MATIQHCVNCFETVAAALEGRPPMSLKEVEDTWASYLHAPDSDGPHSSKSKFLSARASISAIREFSPDAPLFVTWNTISPMDNTKLSLRGCIGTFQASPIVETLPNYALSSAFRDPRFTPITIHEMPILSVSVTLLTDFETCHDPLDWVVGRHGIQVHFRSKKRDWNACYLPDVAVEQGWNQEECIINCMQKSGWAGTRLTWRSVDEIKVIRFQGSKESLTFNDWKGWRIWMDKQLRERGKVNSIYQ